MKKVIKKSVWLLFLVVAIFLLNFVGPNDPRVDKIIKQLDFFRKTYGQQKVNLHTDKDCYIAGENIWMKCYLLNAFSFSPDSVSKEIYVDLVNFNNKAVEQIILRNQGGFAVGNILISDTLAEGNYQLRAYTSWMRNFDSDFIYRKTIKVVNPNFENVVTNRMVANFKKFNKQVEEMQNDYELHFFPEGGDLIAGFNSKVAFKAENRLGKGVDVRGSLFSEKGEKVLDFQSSHAGMGFFSFTPNPSVKYYTKVLLDKSTKEVNFELPQVQNQGVSIAVDPLLPQFIRINIRSNKPVSENAAENEIILVGQARGGVLYASKGELKEKSIEVLIRKEFFPTGIVQLTVFDSKLEPLCERLVFIDYSKVLTKSIISISKQGEGSDVKYVLKLAPKGNEPITGNVSLSVCESLASDSFLYKTNILSNLLLTSDLKGRVEDPAFYFTGKRGTMELLDVVMLTHGWRRFVWKDILEDKFPVIKHQPSEGLTIQGKLSRDNMGNPLSNSRIQLSLLSGHNDIYDARTDSKGRFVFPNLNYEDTLSAILESDRLADGSSGYIRLENGDTSKLPFFLDVTPINELYAKDKLKANTNKEKAMLRSMNKLENKDQGSPARLYNNPDAVINVGEEASNFSNILEYIKGRVPGVSVNGNSVVIRGIKTFYASTDPLFLYNGTPIDVSSLSSINPGDIATIEVLKNEGTSIYGSRGANGVIAFYSKKGEFKKINGPYVFTTKGYHKVRAFYAPAYESWQYKPESYKVPRTIYWNPSIGLNSTIESLVEVKNTFNSENTVVTIEGVTNTGEIIYYQGKVN